MAENPPSNRFPDPSSDASAGDAVRAVTSTFLGDVINSVVITAGAGVRIFLVNGAVLSVQPEDWADFSPLIAKSTRWFVGRGHVFQAIANFIERYPRGYFHIVADAGLGKTAIAAELAKRYRAPICFLSASEGRTRADQVLNILSTQIIARYALPYATLPLRAGETSDWLSRMLREAAVQTQNWPVVVIVDALDEADHPAPGHNWLHLPSDLPQGVYIILTHRPGGYPLMSAPGLGMDNLVVTWDDKHQQSDIEAYLHRQAERPEIRRVLEQATPPISTHDFVITLQNTSQGNFMYLAYILEDIAERSSSHDPLNVKALPQGLRGYYEQFWAHMAQVENIAGRTAWKQLYRPIIALLGAAGEPITVEWLIDHTGQERDDIQDLALHRWQRLLSQEHRNGTNTWRIVHQSFADFLAEKVDLPQAHNHIAEYYLHNPVHWTRHSDYAHRHLSNHLRLGGKRDALFGFVDNHDWYRAQMMTDPSGQLFIDDLSQCWTAAEEADLEAIQRGQLPQLLEREVRCALATAGLHSLSTDLPPALLVGLVTANLWTPLQALSAVRQNTDPQEKCTALTALASHIPEALRSELVHIAVDAATAIKDNKIHPPPVVQLTCRLAEVGYHQEALELARAIKETENRTDALMKVVPHLPESLLLQALDMADINGNTWHEAWLFIALMRYVPESLRGEVSLKALTVAQAIEDPSSRATALSAVARQMAGLGNHQQALEIARAIGEAKTRAKTLVQLALYLPEPLASETFPIAIDAARNIHRARDCAEVLAQLLPYIPKPLLQESMEIVRAIEDVRDRGYALIELAPHLPEALLHEALNIARVIHDERLQSRALKKLAYRLAEFGHQQEAVDIARGIKDTQERAVALAQLSQHLPEPLYSEALQLLQTIENTRHRLHALTQVVLYLPDSLLREALQVVHAVKHTQYYAETLVELVPHLSEPLRSDTMLTALDMAHTSRYDYVRVKVLAGLMPYLPGSWLRKVLQIRQTIEDNRNPTEVLIKLILRLPELLKREELLTLVDESRPIKDSRDLEKVSQALEAQAQRMAEAGYHQEALEIVRGIENPWQRALALVDLLPHLPETLVNEAQHAALEAALAKRWRRANSPRDQAKVAVRLAEPLRSNLLRSALDTARVIKDEESQAEALVRLARGMAEISYYQEALATVRAIKEEYERAIAVLQLLPHLPQSLLPEMLEIAQAIEDDWSRSVAFIHLAPRLPEPLRSELPKVALDATRKIKDGKWDPVAVLRHLSIWLARLGYPREALEAAQAIHFDDDRSEALRELAYRMVEWGYPKEALDVVRAVEGAWGRSVALEQLIPHLPKPFHQEALTIAQAIGSTKLIVELIPYLPEPLEALQLALAIEDHVSRVEALAKLIPHLSEPYRSETLHTALLAIDTIRTENGHAEVIVELAPYLEEASLGVALEETRTIEKAWDRAKALVKLLPYLPKPLLQEMLQIAHAIEHNESRAKVLVELAAYLFEPFQSETLHAAWEAARAVQGTWDGPQALAKLASRLGQLGYLRTALDVAEAIESDFHQAMALVELSPHLSDSLLQKALEIAHAIGEAQYRAKALIELVPKLAEPTKSQILKVALKAAQAIEDDKNRAEILMKLTSQLLEPLRSETIHLVLDAARSIRYDQHRAEMLEFIMPELLQLDSSHLYSLWSEMLRMQAMHTREKLFKDIGTLSPILLKLGGAQALIKTVGAILEVSQSWP